jgi:hypothetical protein
MPLTNSRGLGKVVFFSGLKFPIVITPSLMGEPMLTSQAFYFLERMDSAAAIRFESPADISSEREMEYVIDNYLFEYSKRYPDSKMTSKLTEFVYWRDHPEDHYNWFDWRLSECLVLDTLNDDTIVECQDPNHSCKEIIYDWCLFRSYFQEASEEYQKKLQSAMAIRATVKTQDHSSLGTGTFKLPIIRVSDGLLTREQAEMFEVIEPGRPKAGSLTYPVSRGIPSESNFQIDQELISVTQYHDEQLLAYYFSAVRDYSPVSQFKNYYNVLEYFFEDAPVKLGVVAKFEKEQIGAVLRWAVSSGDLSMRISSMPSDVNNRISQARKTSSGEVIPGVNLTSPDIIGEYASHVYQLRNACIHSKKTRKGARMARIAPFTAEEDILKDEMPIMQWLAVQCIEKQ